MTAKHTGQIKVIAGACAIGILSWFGSTLWSMQKDIWELKSSKASAVKFWTLHSFARDEINVLRNEIDGVKQEVPRKPLRWPELKDE